MDSLFVELISSTLNISGKSIHNTLVLFGEGATVPFIARYRKEKTGSLDEVQIADIKKEFDKLNALVKRKETIISAIKEQGKLDPSLKSKIEDCWDSLLLEDIYLPFKKKQKTKATVAKESGLEPLANFIYQQRRGDLFSEAQKFVSSKVKTEEDALQGARYIIAEWFSEQGEIREQLRDLFKRHAIIESKVVKSKKEQAAKFKQYFELSERLDRIPSHRFLAMLRGESEGFLRIKIGIDHERTQHVLERRLIKYRNSDTGDQLAETINDALKRLLYPSISNEFRKGAKEKADKEAIDVFVKNLKQLLLAAPLGSKNILALDPGFKTGCKVVLLNVNGELVHNDTIFPHPPQSDYQKSVDSISKLVSKFKVEAFAIGNGTAGKETYQFIKSIKLENNPEVFFVNESGASIYSASKIAREEFPDKDVTVRGAVSIGRRLMDPLAELVKIDPKSIGVGQYQHDVNQSMLKESLDATVVSCVNAVGINLNTASEHILQYVSGLGPTLAKNIIEYRSEIGAFTERKELMKVPRMGKKAFEQASGFLRIRDGKNVLDNTGVHPESYTVVKKMAKSKSLEMEQLIRDTEAIKTLDLNKFVTNDVGLPTLKDIQKELLRPGLDPRGEARAFQFSNTINSISDLSLGMILPGVVNNLTKFGAFVDIGIKESGMVHISEIANRFIKDPAEELQLNQEVQVKVIDIDKERARVSLSIKQAL